MSLEKKPKRIKEYFMVLDGEFAEGKTTATIFLEDPDPSLEFDSDTSEHVVTFRAYASALAQIALLQAELNEAKEFAEVPGLPTPDGDVVEPAV